MAESVKRLTGPQAISANPSSPTTLFTVPPKKTYVMRDVTAVSRPVAGAASASTPTVILGLTNVTTPANVFYGNTLESVAGGYTTENSSLAIPFTEGETVVAAVDGLPYLNFYQYRNANAATWYQTSSADATSYSSPSAVIQANVFPSNVYFFVMNTKATTPDAVSSITDNHTPVRAVNISSIVTVATSTIRGSVWGGHAPGSAADSATWTVSFGANTQTGCQAEGITFAGSSMALGAPTTSDVILQTATNSGTTETAQGVTMTPTTGDAGFQVMMVATTGVASTYTAGAGGVEINDGTIATPASTAAIYLFDPPVTNPTSTLASAGTSWVAVCLEIARGGHPISLTTSGVIIE